MSTRYMKKVYGSDVLFEKDNENENEIENSIIGNVKSKTFNLFDVVCINCVDFIIFLLTISFV